MKLSLCMVYSVVKVELNSSLTSTLDGGVGHVRASRPDHDQQHCYHHAPKIKPEATTAVVELLMMGGRTPETCRAVHKLQVIKLEKLLHLVG